MKKIFNFSLFLINIPLIIIEFLIIGRFLILLFDVEKETNLYKAIYQYSEMFVRPFARMLPSTAVEDTYVIDPTILLAAAVFALIAYIIRYFIIRARDGAG